MSRNFGIPARPARPAPRRVRAELAADLVLPLRVPVTGQQTPYGLLIRYPIWSRQLRTDEAALAHMRAHPMQAVLHSVIAADLPQACRRLRDGLVAEWKAFTWPEALLGFSIGCAIASLIFLLQSCASAGWSS